MWKKERGKTNTTSSKKLTTLKLGLCQTELVHSTVLIQDKNELNIQNYHVSNLNNLNIPIYTTLVEHQNGGRKYKWKTKVKKNVG